MPTKSLLSIITSMILLIGIIFTSNLFLSTGNVVKAFTKLFPQAPANGVFVVGLTYFAMPLLSRLLRRWLYPRNL